MQITVVAVMCHTIGAAITESVGTLPDQVCREVIVIKDDMPMRSCMLSQPAPLAEPMFGPEDRGVFGLLSGYHSPHGIAEIICYK
jgi:hypothetical protein